MQSREDGVAAAALSSRPNIRKLGRVSRLRALSEICAGCRGAGEKLPFSLPRVIRSSEFGPFAGARSCACPNPAGERLPVPRRVKDFIDISEYTSLDDLIRYLETIRDNLPPEHQAEMKIRGDEIFGRRLTITYFREQTPDEVELEFEIFGRRRGRRDDRGSCAASSTRFRTSWARRTAARRSSRRCLRPIRHSPRGSCRSARWRCTARHSCAARRSARSARRRALRWS